MKLWTEWEFVRRQVAVSGRVLGEDGNPVDGAKIVICPVSAETKVKASKEPITGGQKPPGGTSAVAGPDGIFFFMDLPDGKYVMTAVDPRSNSRDEKTLTVSRDTKGNIKMKNADFSLRS